MSKRRITVDNSHLTLVVRKKLFGFARNVQLVAYYRLSVEDVVMSTENYSNPLEAIRQAQLLKKQLGIKEVVVER